MKNKFEPGTRVVMKFKKKEAFDAFLYEDDIARGSVNTNGHTPDKISVKWDYPLPKGHTELEDPDDLMLESEGNKQLSAFEKEFNELTKDVEDDMKQAGELIKKAAKVAEKLGLEDMSFMPGVHPLFEAMEECGWRTSSLSC